MIKPIVVFDFDGVVCDSTDECMVTSWNAWQRWNSRSGHRTALDEFSQNERDTFRPLRPYVRGAGEYYVLRRCLDEKLPLHDLPDFEHYCQIWQEHLQPFKKIFYHERERMRADNMESWLALHPVWPEVVEALSSLNREGRAYIATLKDGESVRLILKAHNVSLREEHMFDQSQITSKLEALKKIRKIEGRPAHEIVFLDDNATHLLAPSRAGYSCYLTGWGNTPVEYFEIASRAGISTIGLAQVLAMGIQG